MNGSCITIYGDGTCAPGTEAYGRARALGLALAGAGWTICNGGYGGTMEAAARGAREAGGRVIGVTCRAFGRSGPNAYVDEVRETADLLERLRVLIDLGAAYVVLPGGTGTGTELLLTWELMRKGLLARRPLLVWTPAWDAVVGAVAPGAGDVPTAVGGVGEVLAFLGRG